MANPPFNVDKVDKERLKVNPRYPFGLAKADNGNYLWIQVFYSAQQNGLIVDYVGIFRDLQKALAIYGSAQVGTVPGETPIKDKAELVNQLREAIAVATDYCKERGVDLPKIRDAKAGYEREKLKEDAVA